jgi:hypothetical protein
MKTVKTLKLIFSSLFLSASMFLATAAMPIHSGDGKPELQQAGVYRIGAICNDGWQSNATGSGACSHHGGVMCWRYADGSCQ